MRAIRLLKLRSNRTIRRYVNVALDELENYLNRPSFLSFIVIFFPRGYLSRFRSIFPIPSPLHLIAKKTYNELYFSKKYTRPTKISTSSYHQVENVRESTNPFVSRFRIDSIAPIKWNKSVYGAENGTKRFNNEIPWSLKRIRNEGWTIFQDQACNNRGIFGRKQAS